ncbi:hypothetical protein HYY75_12685 [bacterium]|nr:hypothetical protein [bacterium]
MNFRELVDWISGRQEKEPPPPTQDLERRRYLRVDLTDGEASFQDFGAFPLTNLSFGGLRISTKGKSLPPNLKKGSLIASKVRFGSVEFTTTLLVCSVTGSTVGFSFHKLASSHSKQISDFLRPRILGVSLREISATSLKSDDPNLKLRWFQGEEGTQVFLWQTLEGDVVKEEFYFFKYMITWNNNGNKLQTGYVNESVGKSGYGRIDPMSVVFFKVPSHRALRLGKTILEISCLPPEAKDRFLSEIVREERRLYHRYVLGENDSGINFFPEWNLDKSLPVLNLSLNGIAFLLNDVNAAEELVKKGDLSGCIEISGKSIKTNIHILYRQGLIVGGSLKIAEEKNVELFALFLAPRLLGQSLEEDTTPTEEAPTTQAGTRNYVFLGIHNTHLLAQVLPNERLVRGRIAFMDKVVFFDRGTLTAWVCPCGIIFPRDWDLPLESVRQLPELDSFLKDICVQMLQTAKIPEEVRNAWMAVL